MATISGIAGGTDQPTVGGDVDLWGGVQNDITQTLGSEAQTKTVNQSFVDNELQRPNIVDYGEKTNSVSSSSGTLTLDIETGNHFHAVLTENVTTLTISNPSASGVLCGITLEISQNGTGGWTFAWPANVKWAAGVAPVVTGTADATDIYVLRTRDAGTTWYGGAFGQDFS